ncbi:claudin-10-like isoform X2 [Gadus macrocephalus]|uniref:claudin-10-like isoform X2 n=1 Tax=Gadus macrocephalus TaxID=80720 RepID=UPI0028CB63F7|nr:claudin-10-like isoform X2 [Gadus macrocephalus]
MNRTVVMYMEMGCFVVCVFGWILVCSTMPTEIWTWSEVGSIVLTTSNYFSNLWKDCISDSTGVSDCKGIPSLLALNWDIHMCRALIIISIILAFFGSVLLLVGMKCTKIGGSEIANARVTFAAGMNFLISGLCSMVAFSFFGNKIRSEFHDDNFRAQNSKAKGVPNDSVPEDYRAISSKGTYISSIGSAGDLGGKSSQGSSEGGRASKASSVTRSSKTYSSNAYV